MLENLVKFNWENLASTRNRGNSRNKTKVPRLFVNENKIIFNIPQEICNKFGITIPSKAYILMDSSDKDRIMFGLQKFRKQYPRIGKDGNEEGCYSFNKTGVQYAIGMVKPPKFPLENNKYILDYEYGSDVIVFLLKKEVIND